MNTNLEYHPLPHLLRHPLNGSSPKPPARLRHSGGHPLNGRYNLWDLATSARIKKQLVIILTLIASFGAGMQAQAQNEVLKIIDVYAMPDLEIINDNQQAITQQTWRIGFKINKCVLADMVVIQLGSTENSGDVLSEEIPMVENNGMYSLSYNGQLFQVQGYEAHVEMVLAEADMPNFNYVTVYVRDKLGNETDKKSLRLK